VAVAVLDDFEQPHPVPVQVAYETNLDGSATLWVWEAGERGASGYGVDPGQVDTGPDQLVSFADFLQEQFFPESEGAWAEARPKCPGHPHPAEPVVIESEAWWVCPSEGHKIGKIGELAA
jgi:hypothetical protein